MYREEYVGVAGCPTDKLSPVFTAADRENDERGSATQIRSCNEGLTAWDSGSAYSAFSTVLLYYTYTFPFKWSLYSTASASV